MKETSVFAAWLASCRLALAGGLFCVGMGWFLFWLYGLPWEALKCFPQISVNDHNLACSLAYQDSH